MASNITNTRYRARRVSSYANAATENDHARRVSSYANSNSASENDSDITVASITRPKRSSSDFNFIRNNNNTLTEESPSNFFPATVAGSHQMNLSESSVNRTSAIDSWFDRFRWLFWRCFYLKIIKLLNFDVWLLSRINSYGKLKTILLILLPLLMFACAKGFYHVTSNPYEELHEALNSVFSKVSSLFSISFSQKEEVPGMTEDESYSSEDSAFMTSLYSLFAVVSSCASSIRQTAFSVIGADRQSNEAMYHHEEDSLFGDHQSSLTDNNNEEKFKLLVSKIVKDEMGELKEYMKTSSQETDANEKYQTLQNEIRSLQHKFESISENLRSLERNIIHQSEKIATNDDINAQISEYKNHIDLLNVNLKTVEVKLGILEHLKNCCDEKLSQADFLELMEKHLVRAFKSVIDGDPKTKYHFFSEWLSSKFLNLEKLMQEINAFVKKQSSAQSENNMSVANVMEAVDTIVLKHVDSIKRNISEMSKSGYSSFNQDLFSEDIVKKIVKEAIMLYDADKTGQVDYALESGGGSVLGTRCSETYVEKYGKLSILNIPFWTNSNSPRTAIQPDVQPGRCWAFKGSQGFLVIGLSATIYPTGFTLEHIPLSLSPSGSIDSAPKNFSVWGLNSEKDNNGSFLGEYWYDINGEPLQYFPVQQASEKPYSNIELQIHSNHGNIEFTCLYRFRVHGERVS